MNWKTLLEDRIKAPIGEEFYVGGAGASDSKSGRIALEPFLKLATALAHCKSGRHDVIWVQDYWENDTFPVVIEKTNVHIIGLMTRQPAAWPIMNAGAHACFSIGEAAGGGMCCEISGLSMITDATHPCIDVVSLYTQIWIHNCAFGEHGIAQDGIYAPGFSAELGWSVIEDNIFGKELVRDGIRVYAPTWTDIKNNRFNEYGGVGINFFCDVPDAQGGWIIGNRFFKSIGAAAGWAITMDKVAAAKIDDNRAMESGVAPQHNPYKDTSTGVPGTTKNGWGANWSGGVTVMPDVS
ncbi:hypothetical protein ES703_36209 [subsurface metagenome]